MEKRINTDTVNQDLQDDQLNRYMNMTDEEFELEGKRLKSQLANQRKQALFGAVNQGVQGVGDIFLQRGGIKPTERKESDLNDFMMKERIKQMIWTPQESDTEEIPAGYASYRGKLYKLPTGVDGGTKTVKQLALEAVQSGKPLEGLTIDETKKIAGVYIPSAKPSAAAEKREVEEMKLSDELGGLLNSFNRAVEENKKVPGFGATGIPGRLAGFGAGVAGKAGYAPATNVYNAQRKAFATVVAKAAGEVRPTDEDIRRFVATLPDTGKSDAENALLISDIQDKVSKGNIGALWGKVKPQTIPTLAGQGGEDFSQMSDDELRRIVSGG